MKSQKQLNYFECKNPIIMVIDIGEFIEYDLSINNTRSIIKDLETTWGIDMERCKSRDYDDIANFIKRKYKGEETDCDVWFEDEIKTPTIYNAVVLQHGKTEVFSFESCLDRDTFINEIQNHNKYIQVFSSNNTLISSSDETMEEVNKVLIGVK